MKITRRQLKRLIESVLREQNDNDDADTTFRFDKSESEHDPDATFIGGLPRDPSDRPPPKDDELGSAFDDLVRPSAYQPKPEEQADAQV